MPSCTQLELFSHGLKSVKLNLIIFPGQQNHQISTHRPLWSVSETRQRNKLTPTSLEQLKDILEEEWHEISLWTLQYSLEFIPRGIAAVLEAKD
jgi:hypothetical protein